MDSPHAATTETLEHRRESIAKKTSAARKSELGQFMTSAPIAAFMAQLFPSLTGKQIRLLDAGAGIGSLTAAFAQAASKQGAASLAVQAWELDSVMVPHLDETLSNLAQQPGTVSYEVVEQDFIIAASQAIVDREAPRFTHAILNPPYKKIQSKSEHRLALREAGIETGNLYSAFVALALLRLEDGGELVAITPRSFCNGVYFRPFRKLLMANAALRHCHVFRSRTDAFRGDEVLQENVIFRITKGAKQGPVTVSESSDSSFTDVVERCVPFDEVVLPGDAEALFHLVPNDDEGAQSDMACFPHTLADLGLAVSTGPVVDFRLRDHLSAEKTAGCVPLIYAFHFGDGIVQHPKLDAKKPNWISENDETRKWLMPTGHYTAVRRLTSKEERRRLVPAVFDPTQVACEKVGFDNHLNILHAGKKGLPRDLARGLAVWLGSTVADDWFRRFNGHTQVNAGDLRALGYPDLATLKAWGKHVGDRLPGQAEIDALVAAVTQR